MGGLDERVEQPVREVDVCPRGGDEVESREVDGCREGQGGDDEGFGEGVDGGCVGALEVVVQAELAGGRKGGEGGQRPRKARERGSRRTWTQTSGLDPSSTSASWTAPSACSSLPRRRNVAALMHQSVLSRRASRGVRAGAGDGWAGGGGEPATVASDGKDGGTEPL